MSSSNRTPFQDITNSQSNDPKEVKRWRDRERYARNKDEISKGRRELRELKKQSTAPVNDENTIFDTHAIGQSGVTQTQFRATEEGMATDVQHYASENPHGCISLVGNDDESEWLHICDAYQLQAKPGGMRPNIIEQTNFLAAGVDDIVGCNNVSLEQTGASSSQSGMCGPVTGLTKNHQYQSRRGKSQQTGQGWYARLSGEKRVEYLERQRIARKQKKAVASSGVEVPQTSTASLSSSPCTPFINVTTTHTYGISAYASPMSIGDQTPENNQDCSAPSGQNS